MSVIGRISSLVCMNPTSALGLIPLNKLLQSDAFVDPGDGSPNVAQFLYGYRQRLHYTGFTANHQAVDFIVGQVQPGGNQAR